MAGIFRFVVRDETGNTRTFDVREERLTIGRAPENRICLDERNVSRRHATVIREAGVLRVMDHSSFTGVHLNGRAIEHSAELRAGDRLRIGDFVLDLKFQRESQIQNRYADSLDDHETGSQRSSGNPGTDPTLPLPLAGDLPNASNIQNGTTFPARLIMLTPPEPGREFYLSKQRLRIGRDSSNDGYVNHVSLSREHADVVSEGNHHRVVDLGGPNGIRVNGERRASAPLRSGDVIELGQVRFRFVGANESYTFDADQTVQAEVHAGARHRPALYGLLAITVAAVATTGVILASRNRAPGTVTPITFNTEGVAETPQSLREALRNCWNNLGSGRYAAAASHGTAALALSPGSEEARACRAAAEAGRRERTLFEQGVEAFRRGQLEIALSHFDELPSDSHYLQRSEVQAARAKAATTYLYRGRRSLANDPRMAMRYAGKVLSLPNASPEDIQDAEAIIRLAHRQDPNLEAGAANGNPNRDAELFMGCAQAPNYSRCILDRFTPLPPTPTRLAAIIEAHRTLENRAQAEDVMQRFVELYPRHRYVEEYRRTLGGTAP